jgi:hypothetical protein
MTQPKNRSPISSASVPETKRPHGNGSQAHRLVGCRRALDIRRATGCARSQMRSISAIAEPEQLNDPFNRFFTIKNDAIEQQGSGQ